MGLLATILFWPPGLVLSYMVLKYGTPDQKAVGGMFLLFLGLSVPFVFFAALALDHGPPPPPPPPQDWKASGLSATEFRRQSAEDKAPDMRLPARATQSADTSSGQDDSGGALRLNERASGLGAGSSQGSEEIEIGP